MKYPEENNKNENLSFKEMLSSLSRDISKKYGISKEEAEKILESKTKLSLEEFRHELEKQKTGNTLSSQETEELFQIVDGYKKLVIEKSKLGIETLKSLVSPEIPHIDSTGGKFLSQKFPNMMKRIENPQNLSDQITGGIVGLVNSGITILDVCLQLGKGIIKSPYDLYLIVSKKGVYENWKRI